MKQNQYLVPAAILALAVVILIVAFKPNKESVSDGMSKETTTLATPSARGGVTAPEMLPLLAKVTELTEKTVQSQNEFRFAQNDAQIAKNQAAQLASEVRAANQALEMSQQEVARLAKIIQNENTESNDQESRRRSNANLTRKAAEAAFSDLLLHSEISPGSLENWILLEQNAIESADVAAKNSEEWAIQDSQNAIKAENYWRGENRKHSEASDILLTKCELAAARVDRAQAWVNAWLENN